MKKPKIKRVNVDFTAPMLAEIDRKVDGLNISRQAWIKTVLARALVDDEPLATHADLVAAFDTLADKIIELRKCREYRPDHNGECLNCDEGPAEHDIKTNEEKHS